jgi:hypothetical protein
MKKTFLFLILFAIILSNCKKDNNDDDNNNNNNNNNPSGVIIKGKISGSKKGGDSLSLSDARKVIITWATNYAIVDITADSFSIGANMGTACALIFLDENYQYIGNLCTDGLEMLPLGNLSNGENTVIDLSTLTMVGTHVIPSHDPFGNEIIITQEEMASFQEVDAFYESLAKNIDTDNNGSPDVLNNTQIFITSRFFLNTGGHWGTDSVPVSPFDTSNYSISYALVVWPGTALNVPDENNLILTGPAGDPYSNISLLCFIQQTGGGFYAAFKRDTLPPGTSAPFKKGIYTLTLNGTEAHTFEYCNINAKYNLVVASPTLHTNSEGKLTSISIEYKLPNGSIVSPENILSDVNVQLTDSTSFQFYSSPQQDGFYTFTPDVPLDISALVKVMVTYSDIMGNWYQILWFQL